MFQVGARGKFELDWEYLPVPCLVLILEKIHVPIAQVQFGAVSRHWHSVFKTFLDYRRQANPVPLLLIPSKKIYSLQAKSKVSEIEFSKPYAWRCCGSCYGWLATIDDSLIMTLSNPFKKAHSILLPRLDFLRLVSFNVNGETSGSAELKVLRRQNYSSDGSYLVKSSMGNLYSIHSGELVESIDGDVVFVGDNQTLSVSALDFPEGQPNSIYFTDDAFKLGYRLFGSQDNGIFHLKDKSFTQYYRFKSSHKNLPPYIWILPPGQFKSTLSN
ncbi:hypothetical protein V6N12_042737 [Hibiscus sabdariffa]|uniref:KIB1-4 beta-propeller domain-containing protein n=1 Tax=Hibiscus sabdariffa TaxID=183260 RepID=A0ABR2AZV8_9ROSI